MADELRRPDLSAFPSRMGGYTAPEPVQPTRTWGEAAKDTGLDLASGFVDVARRVGGVGDAVQTAISTKAPTEWPKMDALSDIQTYILNQRSDATKYIDDNGGPTWGRDTGRKLAGIATSVAPYAGLAVVNPIVAAGTAAVLAYGGQQAEDREQARSGNMDDNSQYLSLIQSGMSDKEARDQLYRDSSDPTKLSTWGRRLPAMVGDAAGWGAGAKFTHGLLRKTTDEITNKVLAATAGRTLATGAGAGAVAGAVQGAGNDWSRQQSEVDMGMRGSVDYGQTAGATVEPGILMGGFGALGKGRERVQMVRARRAEQAAAPPIGTEVLDAASKEAHIDQPPLKPDYVPPGADEYLPPDPSSPRHPTNPANPENPVNRPFTPPPGDEFLPPAGTERPDMRPPTPAYRPPGGDEYLPAPGTERPTMPPEMPAYRPPGGEEFAPPPGAARPDLRPPAPEFTPPSGEEYLPAAGTERPDTRPAKPDYTPPSAEEYLPLVGGEPPKGGGAPPAPPAPIAPPTPSTPATPVAKGLARVKEVARKRKGEKVATSKEETRPQEGPAAEAVARPDNAPQAGGKEEGRSEAPVATQEPSKGTDTAVTPAGVGPKGAEAIKSTRTKTLEKIASLGTKLGDRFKPQEKVELEHLTKKLADPANEGASLDVLTKEAIDEADRDPRNRAARAARVIAENAAKKAAAGREHKENRTKPVRAKRDQIIANALRDPALSMSKRGNGETETTTEMFNRMLKSTKSKEVEEDGARSERYAGGITFKNTDLETMGRLAGRMIEHADRRIKAAQHAMQIHSRSGEPNTSQISWGPPKSKSKSWQNDPWYSALYELDVLKNQLQRFSEQDKGGNTVVKGRNADKVGMLLTDLYIQERAIESGNVHLWDRYRQERAKSDYGMLVSRVETLRRIVNEQQGYKDIIEQTHARQNTDGKVPMSDDERSQYNNAANKYKEATLTQRSAELIKAERRLAEANEQSGIDYYNPNKSVGADYENHLISLLDDPATTRMHTEGAEAYVRWMLDRQADEDAINRAREEKRFVAQPKEKTEPRQPLRAPARAMARLEDIAARNKRPTTQEPRRETFEEATARQNKASKRVLEITDEMERLAAEANLDAVPFHDPESAARLDEIDARMKVLEDEQRRLAEDANPWMLNNDYSVGRVLDPAADLGKKGNLPSGAYVKSVSDFLAPGRPVYGVRASVRTNEMGPGSRYAALQDHVFDIANRLIGKMDVVGLTNEQMMLAADHRGLPPGTPAFYDPKAGRIFISHDVGAPNSAAFKRTLGHEIVHPLSEVALEQFPDIERRLDAVRQRLAKEVSSEGSDAARILGEERQGLANVHEFLSEFFNDGGRIQNALDTIKVKRTKVSDFASALDRVKEVLGDALKRLFLRTTHRTALSDAMVYSLDLFQQTEERVRQGTIDPYKVKGQKARPMTAGDWDDTAPTRKSVLADAVGTLQHGLADRMGAAAESLRRLDGATGAALWAHDFAQLARRAEPGMQRVVEGARKAMAHAFTRTKDINEEAHYNEIAGQIGRAQYESGPGVWDKFEDLYARENQSQISASEPLGTGRNAWINDEMKKNQPDMYRQHAMEHAELEKLYAKMPQRMRDIRDKLRKSYDDRHEAMTRASLKQLIEFNEMAPTDKARELLVKYIQDPEKLTPAEKVDLQHDVPGFTMEPDRTRDDPEYKKFRQNVREMRALPHLRSIEGVWYPKFRRGDWVVEGTFNLAKHAEANGGKLVGETRGTYDFDSAAERSAYIKALQADPVLRKVKFLGAQDIKVGKDGTPAYRATHNPLMLEFHESRHEATKSHAAMKAEWGDAINMTHVEPRRENLATFLGAVKGDRALKAMMDSVHRSAAWGDLDTASQRRFDRTMGEAAVRHVMGAAQRATYLPRRYALGARKDIMEDYTTYMTNTSYSLAELEHRNELKRAFRAVDDYVTSMKDKTGPGDEQGEFGALRRQIQAQLHRRADWAPDANLLPILKKPLGRLMQLSYLSKLASPANWVLNGTELLMSGAPMLAGVHGFRAYGEVIRAMNDLGISKYLDGFKDAATVARAGVGGVPHLPDVPERFRDMIKRLPDKGEAKELLAMLDRLEEYAHLDRDSSMEVSRLFDPGANKLMRGVDYVDNVSRQISAGIDNMNRVVLGMAAMRLARKEGRGGGNTLDEALAHAEKYVGKMAGNYAKYNEAEMFRVPLLGPALQFKRYAQRMTANWLGAAFHAVGLGHATPEERSIARRQLGYMAGTVTLMSGVLGLPTEPIKGVINALSPMTGYNSDDWENTMRDAFAGTFGKDLGYALTRGAPRAYLDLGIGTRLGYDSMWTQGAPGDKAGSVAEAMFNLLTGAPGSYALGAAQGASRLGQGAMQLVNGQDTEAMNNFRHGFQQLVPIKMAADLVDALSNEIGGPETRTRWGQPLGYQPSPTETAMQIAGFRSGTFQERGDLRRRESRDRAKRVTDRNTVTAMYVHASTGAEKAAIRESALREFNQRWPEEPITVGDLLRADQRYKKGLELNEEHPEYGGLNLSKKDRKLQPRYSAYSP